MFGNSERSIRMDTNILRMGRAALINYAYERRAVGVMRRLTESDPSEALAARMKAQAAHVRSVESALLRLTDREYEILDTMYISARPDSTERLAEKFGCGTEETCRITKEALGSFCARFFSVNEKSRGGEAAADISALFLRNDEAVRPVPSLVDRARLLGL